MSMCREYVFNTVYSSIALERTGVQPVFSERCQSFIDDGNISGIILKVDVSCYGDDVQEHKTVMRAAVFRDEDCRRLDEAWHRLSEWESRREDVPSGFRPSLNVHMDENSYGKILDIYRKDFLDLKNEICSNAVCQLDFDYTMPEGKYEDSITLSLPLKSGMIASDTVYRIGVFDLDKGPVCSSGWSWFVFFHRTGQVEDFLRPHSASLRVMVPHHGSPVFDKAVRYRNYGDSGADIHYDTVCMEMEVNPALLCFEVEYDDFDETCFPVFTIVIKSGNEVVEKKNARIMAEEIIGKEAGNPDRRSRMLTLCSSLTEDVRHGIRDGEAEAVLQVFDRTIASFRFRTDVTETGEYSFA